MWVGVTRGFKASGSRSGGIGWSKRSLVIDPCRLRTYGHNFASVSAQTKEVRIPESELPKHAQVVIAGAGMIGNSVAYHLVQQGWSDIVIIDKGRVAKGTSRYGSGVLGLFRPSYERRLVEYCIDLYTDLQKQGYDLGLEHCGSVNLATTKDRMISLRRRASSYRPTGVECHVIDKSEMNKLHPYLNTEDVVGGVWIPQDATVDAGKVSEVFAHFACQGGAKFVSGCGVKEVLTHSDTGAPLGMTSMTFNKNVCSNKHIKVTGVHTDKGTISCDYFVNCAGVWAREIGRLMNPPVRIPICPAEHFFLTFQPRRELDGKKLPNVRDYDSRIYLRQNGSAFMLGVFEKQARPWDVTKHGQESDWNQIKEDHWLHLEPYIRAALRRIPILKETAYDFLINTPDAFTPDGRWILGETPEVANYFVCAGMNGNSLQGAGGVGKSVAEWMVTGKPPKQMLKFEVQRFTSLHNNSKFLYERSKEVSGRHYQLHYPMINEFNYGRKIRTSPIFSELESRGGVFGERMGWERAIYFNPSHHRDDPPSELPSGSWRKPEFLDILEDEYLVCREGVGLMDMSSFAKFIIRGENRAVINYLQKLCSNDIDVPVGGVVPTGMQNEKGGYENDCLLIRRENSFFMVSPTQQQTRILEWMDNHLPEDNSINLQDVTSMYTVISLVGPKSKDLMEEMSGVDMTMQPFSYKEINVGYASGVMVLAVTNTGEPGYSIYIPSEFALQIYDNFMKIGRDYGIRNVGHLAMRMLRIEKFIPFWGEELTADTTPNESNKTFKVKFDKEYFIGKEVLVKQKNEGVLKRLVQFHLEDFNKDRDIWPWGGEAIYRNGEFVGFVSSTAWGFTLQKMVALGFVRHPASIAGTPTPVHSAWLADKTAKWCLDVAGEMVPISAHLHPPNLPIITQESARNNYKHKKKHTPTVQLLKQIQLRENIPI